MGKRDIRVNKSRAQGASYLYSMMFLHRWLFHPMFKVNIVSKDQDAADNAKDPDSIMWKIMFALESLPAWMRGEPKLDWVRSVTDHTLTNKRNGSVIRAYASANVGSGGRAAVFFSHLMHGRPVAVEPSKDGKLPKEYQDPVWWGDLKRRLEDRGFDLTKGYRSPWYDNRLTASRRTW